MKVPRLPICALLIRQSKDIERLAIVRAMDIGEKHIGHFLRAAAPKPRRHGHILLAVDAEADRIALHGRAELGLPQRLAGLDVYRPEDAVIVTDKGNAAAG